MSNTPKLNLEVMSASQSQKQVTVNDDFRIVDALLQLNVISMADTGPPGSPSDGDTYIPAATATGAWVGQANNIAYYNVNAWQFFTPSEGWILYDNHTDTFYYWTGTAWSNLGGDLTYATLGVNATASTTNRLEVASQAILFTHDSTGGNQVDCRLNINKAASGNTASIVFQDAFSERAEIGNLGDDNFHFKVSPDGSTFYDSIQITDSSGAVNFAYGVTLQGVTTINANGNLHFASQTSGAASAAGTLTNAPAAGNPAFWLPVTINGSVYYIPAWS